MVTQESINYIAEGLAGRRKVEFLQIVQQRAELLEALHKICNVSAIDLVKDPAFAQRIANEAITKAEASE